VVMFMNEFLEMSAAKRRDPNYIQISGDVKKDVCLRFKAACTLKQLSVGEGLEQAMILWLEDEKNKNDQTS
jgi:hypothetical protein